jgi:aryl-alcohol dehydrogenase-like predicted oxidoreductase
VTFARFDRARTLAENRGLSVPQVALAYVLGQPLDVFALVGCHTGWEFADDVGEVAVTLTPEELRWLERGYGTG